MFAPASTSSFIVASTPSFVRLRPRVTRVPNSTPAAAISGVTPSLLGRSTSALCFSSSSTNGASPARAARSSGVAPCARIVSPPRSCGTSRYGGRRFSCRFGLAPFSSSILADVERGDRILARQHRHGAVALHRQGADVRRHVERRAAEEIPLIDVGAGLDHERRELEVQIEQRHVERRDALGILEIRSAPAAIRCRAHSTQPSRAAYSSGVKPPLFMSFGRGSVMTFRSHWRTTPRAFRSAPFEARNFTISAWLCAAAHISAVCPPKLSLALMSAPASSSRFAASTLPLRATAISGVSPSGFLVLGSAPALSSASMIGAEPMIAASVIAVVPN